jgi:vacuolar-type H+-ATPase subunit F/Vma7
MTHTLRVVCRPSLCDGFALAGVHALGAADGTEASAVLRELVGQPEPGVIFVEEALYRALPEPVRNTLERRAVPVVVPFPGPRGEARPSIESELVEMLRAAIGHRVRLR